jgi:F-type H+-transporting ATPase subunit b
MHFDWSTLALQTVNFAILVWLLHRYLYRPVLALVDARRAEIDKDYAAARAAEADAKARLAAIENQRAALAAERSAVLQKAAADAEAAAAARRAQAEREAAALLDSARKNLASERDQALAEARRLALDLGAEIARRLLAEMPMQLRAEAWLARIVESLTALSPAKRAELGGQLTNGQHLTAVTASALPEDAQRAWQDRLRRALGDHIEIDFRVDPQLVAGTELHFPNAVLRFSWQSALAAMRAEIEADGNAR